MSADDAESARPRRERRPPPDARSAPPRRTRVRKIKAKEPTAGVDGALVGWRGWAGGLQAAKREEPRQQTARAPPRHARVGEIEENVELWPTEVVGAGTGAIEGVAVGAVVGWRVKDGLSTAR